MIVDAAYNRQHDLCPVDLLRKNNITIVGCGHIGSMAALMLGKSGAYTNANKLTIIDMDKVELENLTMQFFNQEAIGKQKVDALKEELPKWLDADNIVALNGKYEDFKDKVLPLQGIVISAVDKMDIRKMIFEDCMASPDVRLFIDARTGGEYGIIFAINPHNKAEQNFYLKDNWVPDDKADNDPCTRRGMSWTTFSMIGLLGQVIGRYVRGYDISKKYMYDMCNMLLMEENPKVDMIKPAASKLNFSAISLNK